MASLSLYILPFFFFFFFFVFSTFSMAEASNSSSLIYKTCKASAEEDPNISFDFCQTSLQAATRHAHHVSLRRLGLVSLRLIRRNLTSTRRHIKKLRRSKHLDPYVKSCLADCLELYSEAIPTLKTARRDYRAGRYSDAGNEISSVMDASSTCEDGFNENQGVFSPLTNRNQNAFQLSAIALSIINLQPQPA